MTLSVRQAFVTEHFGEATFTEEFRWYHIRIGPGNEPGVPRIVVRLSSGVTICIEKTIKVQFFQSFPYNSRAGAFYLLGKKQEVSERQE